MIQVWSQWTELQPCKVIFFCAFSAQGNFYAPLYNKQWSKVSVQNFKLNFSNWKDEPDNTLIFMIMILEFPHELHLFSCEPVIVGPEEGDGHLDLGYVVLRRIHLTIMQEVFSWAKVKFLEFPWKNYRWKSVSCSHSADMLHFYMLT